MHISVDVQELANIAESKLKAFDRWLLTDCEFGETSEPKLDFDIVEKLQMKPAADPFLFGENAKCEAIACGSVLVENAQCYAAPTCLHHASKAHTRKDVLADKRDYHEKGLQKRAREMQQAWARDSKQLKMFLHRNRFADVNAHRSSRSSFTYPLHVAAYESNLTIVQLLLMAGTDPFLQDSDERTAWDVAEIKNKHGSHDMVIKVLADVCSNSSPF
jgi:hypothetical protein